MAGYRNRRQRERKKSPLNSHIPEDPDAPAEEKQYILKREDDEILLWTSDALCRRLHPHDNDALSWAILESSLVPAPGASSSRVDGLARRVGKSWGLS